MPDLYFGKDRHNRSHEAEEHVEADEELVDKTSLWLGVEDEEEDDGDERQDVV